ncbi:MAG: error-prone DNA polymerase [Burkholderiales bacterium]
MFASYAELHCLSNFSFLRGASHPEELVETAAKLGYTALALTDECSLAGIVRAHVAAKEHRLPLIIGAEFTLAYTQVRVKDTPPPSRFTLPASRLTPHASRLILLATNREGYGNLSELITRARRNAEKGSYRLHWEDLQEGLPHCLVLLLPGETPSTGDARWFAERFPHRAWIATELHAGPNDRTRLTQLQELSSQTGLPLVAAGDVHMHRRSRRMVQDTLTAIRLGCSIKEAGAALFPNAERHLRRRERLARIYPPELLAETLSVAARCEFSLDSLRYEYPEELVPQGETPASHLRRLTEEGFRWRFGCELTPGRGVRREAKGVPLTPALSPASEGEGVSTPPSQPFAHPTPHASRLAPHLQHFTPHLAPPDISKARALAEHELKLIAELKYEAYFLTVHDIVRFARSAGILCQGRGSAANSAVCYCLGITEVDPGRMELLFERFMSKERNEPPDIDVDFEHERREEVIQYIYRKYGRERAALAATVITYRPRSAVRDIGKALGMDLAQTGRLAKNMAWWDGCAIDPQRIQEAGLDPGSPLMQRLQHLMRTLLSFPRHLSQHVGGFVISQGTLSRLVPIENAAMRERTVIQWDKDDLDALGLLKVDVLALGMLSAIRRAIDLVNQHRKTALSMADIPPEDPKVYEMIGRADTIGVFQIESRAQQAMLPRMQPRNFYDLVIEVAIVRPGPIQGGMVHPYLRRRQGIEPVTYPSEAIRGVLERTLGVPIFQEQVMQLAIVAAGFTAGEADKLRRAMAAWRRKGGLEPFEQRLKDGMRARGYTEEFAERIYRQILGFGEYGFPESHSASFALLVYISSWLKCYEPAAFTCALLNSQPMGFYAPSQLVQDVQRHGVTVLPADVMRSDWDCTLEEITAGNCALRLGLRMVKGLSRSGAQGLTQTRESLHRTCLPSTSFETLAHRAGLDTKDMNALASAGALASFAGHRHQAAWLVMGTGRQAPLFSEASPAESPPELRAPSETEDLLASYASLGLTLGRHPLALLRPQLARLRMRTALQLKQLPHKSLVRTAGLVIGRQRPDTASGVIFVTLEDETGMTNVVVWHAIAERQRRVLLGTNLLGVHGILEREGEVIHLIAGRLVDYRGLFEQLTTASRDFH